MHHPNSRAHANRIRILIQLQRVGADTRADRFELQQLIRLWYPQD